jgi:hypothetical protein
MPHPTTPLPAAASFIYPDSYNRIQEHFADEQQHRSSRLVLSIAALRLVNCDGFTTKDGASVLGYYAEGDDGGGEFRWDPFAFADHDGGFIIRPTVGLAATGNGRWIRILTGRSVNVRWWGAKGDGVANDQPAIQKAIDFVCPTFAATWGPGDLPALGGTVYLPKGTYLVNANVRLRTQVTLTGDGWSTVIKGGGACTRVIEGDPQINKTVMGCAIEKLCVHGGARADSRVGIYLVRQPNEGVSISDGCSGRDNFISHVLIVYCWRGIQLVNDQGLTMIGCAIWENVQGLLITDNSQLGALYQCSFRNNKGEGTRLEGSSAIIDPAWGPGDPGDRPFGWLFSRCHWESNDGVGLVIDGASNNTVDTCKFEQNHGGSVVLENAVTLYDADGNMFKNTAFVSSYDVGHVSGTNDNVVVKGPNHVFDSCLFGFTSPERLFITSQAGYTKVVNPRGGAWGFTDSGAYSSIEVLFADANHPARWVMNAGVQHDGRKVTLKPRLELQDLMNTGSDANGALIIAGNGTPENVWAAPRGSLWLQLDGTGGALWVKQTGAGVTGWALK